MANEIKLEISVDGQPIETMTFDVIDGVLRIGHLKTHNDVDIPTDKLILELLESHVSGIKEAIKIREQACPKAILTDQYNFQVHATLLAKDGTMYVVTEINNLTLKDPFIVATPIRGDEPKDNPGASKEIHGNDIEYYAIIPPTWPEQKYLHKVNIHACGYENMWKPEMGKLS